MMRGGTYLPRKTMNGDGGDDRGGVEGADAVIIITEH